MIKQADELGSAKAAQAAFESIADIHEQTAPVVHARMMYQTAHGDPDTGIALAERLRVLAADVPGRQRTIYAAHVALAVYRSGDVPRAAELLEEAYELAKKEKIWSSCVRLASILADLNWDRGNGDLTSIWYNAAVAHAKQTSNWKQALHFHSIGLLLALDRGDCAKARAILNDAVSMYPRAADDRLGLDRLAYSIRIDLREGIEPSANDLATLLAGHFERRGQGLHDTVADTLFAALTKAGRGGEAAQLRDQYLSIYRNDRLPIPTPLTYLAGAESLPDSSKAATLS
jgi:tetratricopeptide (TPR) repeat protein